jgi:hypothetical protein
LRDPKAWSRFTSNAACSSRFSGPRHRSRIGGRLPASSSTFASNAQLVCDNGQGNRDLFRGRKAVSSVLCIVFASTLAISPAMSLATVMFLEGSRDIFPGRSEPHVSGVCGGSRKAKAATTCILIGSARVWRTRAERKGRWVSSSSIPSTRTPCRPDSGNKETSPRCRVRAQIRRQPQFLSAVWPRCHLREPAS